MDFNEFLVSSTNSAAETIGDLSDAEQVLLDILNECRWQEVDKRDVQAGDAEIGNMIYKYFTEKYKEMMKGVGIQAIVDSMDEADDIDLDDISESLDEINDSDFFWELGKEW